MSYIHSGKNKIKYEKLILSNLIVGISLVSAAVCAKVGYTVAKTGIKDRSFLKYD